MTFLAGLASGVVLTSLSYFVRLLLQRRSRGEPMVELSMKKLRPFIILLVGFILLPIGLFGLFSGERLEGVFVVLVAWAIGMIMAGAVHAS